MSWSQHLLTLYPNFNHQASLSTNHLEVGEHVSKGDPHHKKSDYTVPLLRDSQLLNRWLETPFVWEELVVLSLFGEPYRNELKQAVISSSQAAVVEAPHKLEGSWRRAGDNLVESIDFPWGGRLQAGLFMLCVQEDGNLVVYDVDERSGFITTPVWRSSTGSKRTIGNEVRLELAEDGNLVLLELVDVWWMWRRFRRVLWTNGYHGALGPHVLLLNTNGIFQVLRGESPCSSGVVPVWSSGEFDRRTSDLTKMCGETPDAPAREVTRACSLFQPDISEFLRQPRRSHLTVLMKHTGGNSLAHTLAHYASSPIVDTILVTWGESIETKPEDMKIGWTTVHFNDPFPNDIFYPPSMLMTTNAVLAVEENTIIHHEDVNKLFQTWQQDQRSFVGLLPVQFDRFNGAWVSRSADTSFDAVSSNGAIFDVHLLDKLSCEASSATKLRGFAACGDFSLSLAGSLVDYKSVHVKPTHSVTHFGKTQENRNGSQDMAMLSWKCDLQSFFVSNSKKLS